MYTLSFHKANCSLRSVLFILIFCLLTGRAAAQDTASPRRLFSVLQQSKPDTTRIELLIELGGYYLFKPGEDRQDLDSAIYYFRQAETLSRQLNRPWHVAKSREMIANYYAESGDTARFKQVYEDAIRFYHQQGDLATEADAWNVMGDFMDARSATQLRDKIDFYERARSVYLQMNDPRYKIPMLQNLANIQQAKKQDSLREASLKLLLAECKAEKRKEQVDVFKELGNIEFVKGNYSQVITYCLDAIKSLQELGDTSSIAIFYHQLAYSYFATAKYNEAAAWERKSIASAGQDDDVFSYKTFYITTLITADRPAEARPILLDLLQLKTPVAYFDTIGLYNIAAQYYSKVHNREEALKYYQKILATDLKKHIKNYYQPWFIATNIGIADIHLSNHQASKAGTYLRAAQAAAATDPYLQPHLTLRLNQSLYTYYLSTRNYQAAVKSLEISDRIKDSLFTASKEKQIAELNIKYETTQKEQSIKDLRNQSAIQDARLEKANLQRNVTIGGVALILIIAGLLYRQSKLRKKNNQIITRKNALLQSLITEKEWLLKEVHHRVKNNLHSVICLLEAQAAYLENDALQAIEKSQHRIYTMSLIHQKLYQSDDIQTIDMTVYIPELVQYLRDSSGVGNKIHFVIQVDPIQLNAAQAIPLALIINEALTNSIKYAFPGGQPGEITLSLTRHEEKYRLVLADNGIGMPITTISTTPSSLGLELIKGLTKEIRGDISFAYDAGVKITIAFEHDALDQPNILHDDYLKSA